MTLILACAIALLSGFVALSYEILWYRAFSFVSGGSPAAFGLLLGAYLLGLAVGALASEIFCRDRNASGSRRQLAALGGFVFLANLSGYLVLPALAMIVPLNLHLGSIAIAWGAGLPLVTISAGMMGAILPLVSHFGIVPDAKAGARLSYVYLANILGSALGSLLTGLILMQIWSTSTIGTALAIMGLLLSAGLFSAGRNGTRQISWILGGTLAGAIGFATATPLLLDRWHERLLYGESWQSGSPLRRVIENRHGIIAAARDGTVYGGGIYDGMAEVDLVTDRNLIERAYGVAALHPAPKQILSIGLSSGAWAKVLADLPGVERLIVVEINPGYIDLIRDYPDIAPVLEHPKVEIVIDDGRRWLARNPRRKFDVIVSNTTFHWRASATNLLSREFLEIVRARLNPGGIYHFNTTDSKDAFKTAFTVFPYGLRFFNFVTVSDAPIVFDTERWEKVLALALPSGDPSGGPAESLQQQRLATLRALPATIDSSPSPWTGLERRESVLEAVDAKGAVVITDDNMKSEWRFTRREVFTKPP